MVEQRIQRVDESGVEYAMNKAKHLRLSPHNLEEREKVDYLIQGVIWKASSLEIWFPGKLFI